LLKAAKHFALCTVQTFRLQTNEQESKVEEEKIFNNQAKTEQTGHLARHF